MTDRTNIAAALLRDAIISGMRIATETPIEQVPAAIADVLAALSRALDPALTERAGAYSDRLRSSCFLAFDDGTNDYGTAPLAADLLTALLTANAALRAERDELQDQVDALNDLVVMNNHTAKTLEARAEAAEAEVEKLRGAMIQMRDDKTGFRHAVHFRRFITAALTETATTEKRHDG